MKTVLSLALITLLLWGCVGSEPAPDPYAGCCAVCDVGKACGDSCIARDETCYEADGCACDRSGFHPVPPQPVEDCCPDDLPEGCSYEHCDCEGMSVVCYL